jgi:hypothetical protein
MALKHDVILHSLIVKSTLTCCLYNHPSSQLTSLTMIEILLSIVHYIVIISLVIMVGQIIWTFFSIYRENQKSTIESE